MNYTDEDYGGRGYYRGKPNYLCMICGKSSGHYRMCCTQEMICIGPKARSPKITDNKKKWKKFCEIWNIDYSKLQFLK